VVALQALLLAALIVLPRGADWPTPTWLEYVGVALALLGLVVIVASGLRLGSALTPTPVPAERARLVTTGAYKYVRHPIYSGVISAVIGLALRSGSWRTGAVALVTLGFFWAKSSWEESLLRQRFPEYDDYASERPRFVPRWPRRTAR